MAKNALATLVATTSHSTIDASVQGKMRRRGEVRVAREIALVISNEYLNEIIRIVKSLESSVSKAGKNKIKNKMMDLFVC